MEEGMEVIGDEKLKKIQDRLDEEENNLFKIDASIRKLMLENCFRLNDLSYESKYASTKTASNGQTDADGNGEGANTAYHNNDEENRVIGVIAENDPMFQEITEKNKEDAIKKTKIKGFPDLLFYGIPFKSKFFIYDITGVLKSPYFTAKYVEYKPIPFTMDVAGQFLDIIKGGDIEDYIASYASDVYINTPAHGFNDSMPTEREHFIEYVESLGNPSLMAWIKHSPEGKRYFLSNEIATLCDKRDVQLPGTDQITEYPPIYNYDHIVNMAWEDIKGLFAQITTDPYTLAFSDLIPYKYFPSKDMINNNPALVEGYLPIPELSFFTIKMICDIFKDTVIKSDKKMAAVKIYDLMKKETFESKHAFSTRSHMKQLMSRDFSTLEFNNGMDFLIEHSIVLINTDEEIFIRYVYMWEKCIANSFELLMQRSKSAKIEKRENSFYEKMTTFAGHKLCDEQLEAVKKFHSNPITVINGIPGSGKTDMLGIVSKLIQKKNVIATASQSLNVARLNQIFPQRSFTAHKLLYFHDSYCKSSPHSSSRLRSGDKAKELGIEFKNCPFEDISTLFCEEFSMWDEALFSKLISAIICCGKLTKVMMIGDTQQLQSIRMGNTMREITQFAEEFDFLCKFTHNHRTGASAQILGKNLRTIREMTPDNIEFDEQNCIHVDVERRMSKFDKIEYIKRCVLNMLKKFKIGEYEHHIITRTNEYKNTLIESVNTHYHQLDQKTRNVGPYKTFGHYVGRKLAFTQNNYKKGLSNNEIMVLKLICDTVTGSLDQSRPLMPINTADRLDKRLTRTLYLETLLDARQVEVVWDDWTRSHLKRCNTTTVNTFQGSEISTIIFVLPYATDYDTFEMVNTAWSRCKKRLIFIGNLFDLKKAIMNLEKKRRSKLAKLSIESCEKYRNSANTITPNQNESIIVASTSIFSRTRAIEESNTEKKAMAAKSDRPFASAMMALSTKKTINGATSIEKIPFPPQDHTTVLAIETKPSSKYADLELIVKHQKFLDIVNIIARNELAATLDLSKHMLETMVILRGSDAGDGVLDTLLTTMRELLSSSTMYSRSIIDSRTTALYTSVLQQYNDDQESRYIITHPAQNVLTPLGNKKKSEEKKSKDKNKKARKDESSSSSSEDERRKEKRKHRDTKSKKKNKDSGDEKKKKKRSRRSDSD